MKNSPQTPQKQIKKRKRDPLYPALCLVDSSPEMVNCVVSGAGL
jgi:hypothetical protein